MGIDDYLSREPSGDPWSESILVQKFVATSIEFFQKALDCSYSRLSDTETLNRNKKFLEYSKHQNESDNMKSGTVAKATKTVKIEQRSTGTTTF